MRRFNAMCKMKTAMKWTDAIIEVLERHGGAATLNALYAEVPDLAAASKADDIGKMVRSTVELLKNGRGKNPKIRIKRIGLGSYALLNYEVDNNLFDAIEQDKLQEQTFSALPEKKLHGHLQGMLVEIGNMKNFQTYTPDKNVVLNGKKLSEVASLDSIPRFTYDDRLDLIRQIDVVWFENGYPVQTFDVEHSTNFTTALLRSYQLKYFKTKCFMVADQKKANLFAKRIATKPFDEIKDDVTLVESAYVFEWYKQMIGLHNLEQQTPFFEKPTRR